RHWAPRASSPSLDRAYETKTWAGSRIGLGRRHSQAFLRFANHFDEARIVADPIHVRIDLRVPDLPWAVDPPEILFQKVERSIQVGIAKRQAAGDIVPDAEIFRVKQQGAVTPVFP